MPPSPARTAGSHSGDGERIAFSEVPLGMTGVNFVMDADGQNRTPVPGAVGDTHATLSPDGQRIAFERGTDIFAVNVDGSNLVNLTNDGITDENPSYSPSGQQIVFSRNEGGDFEIFVMNAADGSGRTPLTNNAVGDRDPSFSPSGQQIIFTEEDGTNDEIAVINAGGGAVTPLTNTPADEFGPVFSPDGQRIAFGRAVGVQTDIFVMNADGQNESPLVTGPDNEFSPDWQPLNPPSCSLTGPSKSKSVKEVVVTVLCSENANAAATGELTAKAPKLRLAVASKKKHVPLPPATASVTPGTPTAITLAIPKKGRKALKKSGKPGTATIAVRLTDDTAQSTTLTQTIKVKPKKKKK
jgi:Tol biopolymer transport system component